MKVFFHNFNPASNSGPNKFTRQLSKCLIDQGKIKISHTQEDSDVEFALINLQKEKAKPTILRLDGIYFNSSQNYNQQNEPIRYAYENSDHVVFQSNFNKKLTEEWFGPHNSSSVIRNGADLDLINQIDDKILDESIDRSIEVWSCASSWRPHKRLEENLRYFELNSPRNSVMMVAGRDADVSVIKKYNMKTDGRVFYMGELNYQQLISLYKRSSTLVHLAYLDHCPNVVVDARAAECQIVCASSGGTKEIAGEHAQVILEEEWDHRPIELYNPPTLNFSKCLKNSFDSILDIKKVADEYYKEFKKLM